MHVLFVYEKGSLGGAPRVMFEVAQYVAARGDRISVALGGPGPAAAAYRPFAATVAVNAAARLPRRLARLVRARRTRGWLEQVARQVAPDVIYHTVGVDDAYFAWAAAQSAPVIAHVHGLHARRFGRSDAFLQQLARYADRYVACAEVTRQQLIGALGVPAGKTVTLHNGINRAPFDGRDVAAARRQTRQQLGIPPDALTIVAIGGIGYGKGTDLFVQTVAALRERAPERAIAAIWVGGQPERGHVGRAVAAYVQARGLAPHVYFTGYQADVFPYLAAADLYVGTSREDVLPLVMMEALAVGVPVVSVPVGAVHELLTDEVGRLVPYHEPSTIAATVLALVDDADRYARLAAAGPRHIAAHFDATVTLPAFHTLIHSVVGSDDG